LPGDSGLQSQREIPVKSSRKQASLSKQATVAEKPKKKRGRRISKMLRSKMREARYLLLLLGSLVIADGLISNYIVNNGLGKEGNPFLQDIVGQTSFIFIKSAGAIIGGLLLWRVFRKHHRLGWASIVFYIVIYTSILWLNLATWFIAQHGLA
jgi:hypothetical protein